MPLVVILAAAAVASAVPLLWWSVASSRLAGKSVDRAALTGARPAPDLRAALLQQSATQRAVLPALQSLSDVARRLSPVGWIEGLDRRLTLAGRPPSWPLERVLAAKVLLGLAGCGFGFLFFADRRTSLWLLLWVALTALGYFVPDLLLHSNGEKRREAVAVELPDTLDQMTIAVEAGLGFEAAMARVARTGTGVLAQELRRTLQEIQVGVPRKTALRDLAKRVEAPDLRRFVMAVVQAEGYGIPIADVLRAQAGELRVKRRQRAEEKAMKIPVKVLFPMIVFILPVIFIIILGPAIFQLGRMM